MESEHPQSSTSEEVVGYSSVDFVTCETLKEMSKITRHDIRNKLAIIMGYQDIARMKLAKGEEIETYLDGIRKNCLRILGILDFNRDFERLGVEEKAPVKVALAFHQAAEFFKLGDVKLVCECGDMHVIADSLLTRIFYNLIDNSLKYGESLSTIRLYSEGDNKIIYEDDGVGIPEDKRAKISSSSMEDAGVHGLTLINKIIESYDWTLTEEGKPDVGVKFVINLPENVRRR